MKTETVELKLDKHEMFQLSEMIRNFVVKQYMDILNIGEYGEHLIRQSDNLHQIERALDKLKEQEE